MTKVLDTQETWQRCICGNCLTYQQNDCPKNKTEGLFCARGKTDCDLPEERGCICGNCQNWQEYDLSKGYFCLYSAAQEEKM